VAPKYTDNTIPGESTRGLGLLAKVVYAFAGSVEIPNLPKQSHRSELAKRDIYWTVWTLGHVLGKVPVPYVVRE
jgi:hypothetical protein